MAEDASEQMESLSLTEGAEAGGEGGADAPSPPPAADAAETPEDPKQDAPPEREGVQAEVELKLPPPVPEVKLFVGGLQEPTTDKSLKEYFSQFGEIVEAVVKFNRVTGGPRGYGFVAVRGAEVAEAICAREHQLDGYGIQAPTLAKNRGPSGASANADGSAGWSGRGRRGRPSDRAGGAPREAASQFKVFVGGLSHDTTIESFREFFEKFGALEDSIIMHDHVTNRPRGFGFVTYTSADSVTNLLQSNFHELNGRRVEVKLAVPRESMRPPEPRAGRPAGRDFGPYGANSLATRRMLRGEERDVVMPHYSFNSYSPEPVYGGHEFGDQYVSVPTGIPVQSGVAPPNLPYGPTMPPPSGVAPLLPMPGAALPLPAGGAPKMPVAPGEQPGMGRGGGYTPWNRPGNAPRQVYGGAPSLPAFLPIPAVGHTPYAMQQPGVMPGAMMLPGASPAGILPVGVPSMMPEPPSSPHPGGAE